MDINCKIEIETQTHYMEAHSSPHSNQYVFTYTITIRNSGTEAAQLIARHWIIKDSNGKIQEVRGEGVVGEKPYLAPGEAFRYTSSAVIETPVGTMQGEYRMIKDNGEMFDAIIPAFTLSIPRVLH